MTRLSWNAPSERFFETGLDRGVVYPKNLLPGPIDSTNYALNPRASTAAGAIPWTSGSGAGGTTTAQDFSSGGWSNLPYRKITWVVAPTSENYTQRIYATSAITAIPVIPGEVISVGIQGLTTLGKTAQVVLNFYNNAAFVSSQASALLSSVDGDWQLHKKENVTVPAGVNYLHVALSRGAFNTVAIGDVLAATALIVVRGSSLPTYFDGVVSDNLHTEEWLGDPNNSPSIRRLIVNSAFVWNGLTSVDEEGSDGAVNYYIDGRAFMHFPTPKEFQATLKAYVYPDAFSELLGLSEIENASGLLVDSQVGEQFGLSYRTLVGNGTDGLEHGYKIHLIYNAVAVPQSNSYESLSLEINPSEFSWQLSAVPVPIEGYRPTAHFIIDTRKMSDEILTMLEDMLYGSPTQAPYLPDPVDVVELLTYGGAIVIVDNGDGTWSAMGSRHDIYLLDEDTFQIDNVEMVDYGDGFFGVTTTPA